MMPHYTLICCCSVAQPCLTLCDPMGCSPARLLCPWDSPDKDTGVGGHGLLQRIFLTQRSNPHLLPWPADSLPLSHLRSPHISMHCVSFLELGMLSRVRTAHHEDQDTDTAQEHASQARGVSWERGLCLLVPLVSLDLQSLRFSPCLSCP